MLGNIGNLLVKCMRQVTKSHLYHLFGYRITTVNLEMFAQYIFSRSALDARKYDVSEKN